MGSSARCPMPLRARWLVSRPAVLAGDRTRLDGAGRLSLASPSKDNDVLVGVSAPMQRVARQLQQVSAYGYPLLIAGERGSGKELAARHDPRTQSWPKPFVALDCSSLGPTLLKAELFGYERGAFLGASETKWGALALAGEGTLATIKSPRFPLHCNRS